MKKHKLMMVLLASLLGLLFFSFNGNTQAKAASWHNGIPGFLDEDNYANDDNGEVSYDEDSDTLTVNSGQNYVTGNDLYWYHPSKHVYYINAENDDDDDDSGNEVPWFKITTLRGDRIKVQISQEDDGSDMEYAGIYTAE